MPLTAQQQADEVTRHVGAIAELISDIASSLDDAHYLDLLQRVIEYAQERRQDVEKGDLS